jgi:hypothetical protein
MMNRIDILNQKNRQGVFVPNPETPVPELGYVVYKIHQGNLNQN